MTLIILLLPLFNFLYLTLLGSVTPFYKSYLFAIMNITITFLLSCICFYQISLKQNVIVIDLLTWINSGSLQISWSLLLDSLSALMLIVVTSVSMCVHYYSFEYMREDPHLKRFIAYLSFFTFFMLILVTANNLLQMFVGWEGVGLCSYLLINFWFQRIQANKAALKAMIVNRIGDFGLALGLFTLFYSFESINYATLFSVAPDLSNIDISFFNWKFNCISLSCFFIFIGAVGKSAQIGLHTWLPDAMEGPTPVSALIHAATMVTAGVFLICRCSFLFQYTPNVTILITILGSLTAFLAGTTGLVQYDLKRVIAYSTCSQLGYMVFACGVSNYFVSMFHLFNHAFFKAALFLGAGSVIHGFSDEQDMRKMGASYKFLYFTYIAMFIGSFSLQGFPFLTGFFSKDAILELTVAYFTIESFFADWLGTFTACSTAFYSIRSLSRTFFGQTPNGWKQIYTNIHESEFWMCFPILFLSLGGFAIGYLTKDLMIGPGINFWGNSLLIKLKESLFFEAEFLDNSIKELPLIFSFIGSISASILFESLNKWQGTHLLYKFITKNQFIIKIHTFLNRKWFFDKVYNEWVNQHILNIAYKHTYQHIDRGLLELIGPNGISNFIYSRSNFINQLNIKFLYHHLLFILIIGLFFTLTLILWKIWFTILNPQLIIFIFIWIILTLKK